MYVGVLAGKTQLRELTLQNCTVPSGAAGVAQLLSHLQPMQQLSRLSLYGSMQHGEEGSLPATAFAAITASSQLQEIDISDNVLPAGVWQHLFPAGRRLPHLTCLEMSDVRVAAVRGGAASAAEISRLVSCCPGLQSLDLMGFSRSVPLLGPLQRLSGLHTLHIEVVEPTAAQGFIEGVCLTGLRELDVSVFDMAGQLLQLTQLRQLTALILGEGVGVEEVMRCKVSHTLTSDFSCGFFSDLCDISKWLTSAVSAMFSIELMIS
jgi:hypothetical protein